MTEYKLLNLRQVAVLFQIPEREVRELLRDGCLPGYKLSRLWRISLDDMNAFIRQHENVPLDELRKVVNVSNGVQRKLNAPRARKKLPLEKEIKINGGATETHSDNAQRQILCKWAPPWRWDE